MLLRRNKVSGLGLAVGFTVAVAALNSAEAQKQSSAATELTSPQVAQTQDALPAVGDLTACMSPSQIEDKDGDIGRNIKALSGSDLCLKQHIFIEGNLRWVLQIVQSKSNPNRIFWIVPHDNEHDAFDSAIYGVQRFGGTVVAVETGGTRFNGPQDPNRNFDAGTGVKCQPQVALSPIYTVNVMRWRPTNAPVVALHTNSKDGSISISKPIAGPISFPAKTPIPAENPDHTLIFVASTTSPSNDKTLMQFVKKLNQNGIHVLYEQVSSAKNDCSLSNYASLHGIRNYINIEVVQTDGATQRNMIDLAVPILVEQSTGSVGEK